MKLSVNLLAFCAFHSNVWGVSAFLAQTPSVSYLASLESGSTDEVASSYGPQKTAPLRNYGPPFGSTYAPVSQTTSSTSSTTSSDTTEEKRVKALENRIAAFEQRQRFPVRQVGGPSINQAKKVVENSLTVQGGSLKTWTFASPVVERVQVVLKTEGRPLDSDIELWQGPDNIPVRMRVYNEDGSKRPFSAVIETPRGPNTVAIRNTGHLEFPLAASVTAGVEDNASAMSVLAVASASPRTIQGGALKTYPFDPFVERVAVVLKTDGRPLKARIELLQGPNTNKQVIELYTEDGLDRPFFAVIETPGSGNVVKVINTAPMEFPLSAVVEPYSINTDYSASEPVIGGDSSTFRSRSSW